MKKLTILRGAVAVSMLAGAVAAKAQALNWSSVFSFADCGPSGSEGNVGNSTAGCSTDDAIARADTTFTSMKASIRTSATAPDGDYMAGNIIGDSLVATAGDGRLAGTAGKVRFSAAFDGQMSAQTDLRFEATRLIPGTNVFEFMPLTTNFFGAPTTELFLSYRSRSDKTIDAVASWELPVVFGESARYSIGCSFSAYSANAVADFSHTWTLVGLDAFDAASQAVAASFSVGSGAALPTTPVPEAQSLALMLAGLGGLGLLLRRRGRA